MGSVRGRKWEYVVVDNVLCKMVTIFVDGRVDVVDGMDGVDGVDGEKK